MPCRTTPTPLSLRVGSLIDRPPEIHRLIQRVVCVLSMIPLVKVFPFAVRCRLSTDNDLFLAS